LAKIPGPKLAALTPWYNAYYDLVKGGQYVWRVEEMHRQYGPIIRPRPDTVHVNDPAFVDKLYTQSPKLRRERYKTVLNTLHAPGSILATQDHDMHRRRRAALNPYFSHQNVRKLVPVINDTVSNLLRRMDGWAREGSPVQMNTVFRGATMDVIQEYCFGGGQKCLDMEDCNAAFFEVITPQRVCHLGTHVHWLAALLANLPPALMKVLLPRVGVFADFINNLAEEIKTIKQAKELPEGRTIFHEILQSDIPEPEKEVRRLTDEAMILVVAGSESTASTLVAITYHMLSEPESLARLKAELQSVMPTATEFPADPAALDGLPYLNAVIQEAIRLYPGATHRQDRVAPDEDLVYESPDGKHFIIPAGTGVGMTAPHLNRHPDLYKDPESFLPQRYIDDPYLSKHLFSFSKGTRRCIGINLAYQELQSFTAAIFRKYDLYDPTKKEQGGPTLELYQTKREDVAIDADYIMPAYRPGSAGLRIRIRQ
jgi:cytochrome P450